MSGTADTRRSPRAGLRTYRPAWLRSDLIAGLTVWAVLVPESLAYATIAGVPPVVGLYAAVPSLVLYLLLGSSRLLVVAPMSASAALSASIATTYAAPDAADFLRVTITLALVTGVVGLLAGALRLGFLASFISEPVLKGFIVGLALVIIVGQVGDLLGQPEGGEGFFGKTWSVIVHLPDLHPVTAVLGVGALVLVLVARRFLPTVPAALLAVVVGIVCSWVWDLGERGVSVVGTIQPGLPALGLPDSTLGQYTELLVPAAGVLLVAFAEGLAAARAFAGPGEHIEPSRELAGIGLSNLGAGAVGGMSVSGSLSKTAVNAAAGARTQVANVVVSVLVVVTLLLLTGLFEQLPHAVLAAVVIAAVIDLVDLASLRRLYGVWSGPIGRIYSRTARADFIAAMGALLGVLLLDVLPGLLVGVMLSLVLLLYHASRPHVARLARLPGDSGVWVDVERHPDLTPPADVAVVRVEGPLFFGNAGYVGERLAAEASGASALVLDAATVASIDVTAAQMLEDVLQRLTHEGVRLIVSGGPGQFRDIVGAAGHGDVLRERTRDIDTAVAVAREDSGEGDGLG